LAISARAVEPENVEGAAVCEVPQFVALLDRHRLGPRFHVGRSPSDQRRKQRADGVQPHRHHGDIAVLLGLDDVVGTVEVLEDAEIGRAFADVEDGVEPVLAVGDDLDGRIVEGKIVGGTPVQFCDCTPSD